MLTCCWEPAVLAVPQSEVLQLRALATYAASKAAVSQLTEVVDVPAWWQQYS